MLLRSRSKPSDKALPEPKPSVVFLGEGLCDWLDEHQGCLANVDARLARFALAEASDERFEDLESVDCLVVECATLSSKHLSRLQELRERLKAQKLLVTYQMCNDRWLAELEDKDIQAVQFPPDTAYLAFEIGQCVAEKLTRQGESDLGELVSVKARQFSEDELSAARRLKSTLDCECPRHISDLIRALAHFEEYSASCSVENWQDAAVHACIFAYTGQARWLMEKALSAVLEERNGEFSEELQDLQLAKKTA
jgi:hypothetical protein